MHRTQSLKWTVSQDFLLLVFSWISFHPAPEYPIRTVSNFFENSRRYSQVKVHYGINNTGGKFATGVNDTGHKFATSFASVLDTGGKFATGVNDTSGKFAASVSDTGGNLPPLSTTPVANNSLRLS